MAHLRDNLGGMQKGEFAGVWKLNLSKSMPANGLIGETMRLERTGPDTWLTTIDSEFQSGEKQHQQVVRIFDGKERPPSGTGFTRRGYTEVCRQPNPLTHTVTQKRDGRVVSEITVTLSLDGAVMTSIRKGDGDETLVFDRVPSRP